MRALFLILLAATAVRAEDNLMPRQGAGWTGFKVGTHVRIKTTFMRPGRIPAVTISDMKLTGIGKRNLSVLSVSKNPVGIETKNTLTLPKSGEAGVGETATRRQLENKVSFAAGKKYPCVRYEITVKTAKGGKRVITEWISTSKPRMRIKRTQVTYNAAGKETERLSIVLAELPKKIDVGGRAVTALVYSTVYTAGKFREKSTTVVSRDVPSYNVRVDAETTMDGKVIRTVRTEVLSFETK